MVRGGMGGGVEHLDGIVEFSSLFSFLHNFVLNSDWSFCCTGGMAVCGGRPRVELDGGVEGGCGILELSSLFSLFSVYFCPDF